MSPLTDIVCLPYDLCQPNHGFYIRIVDEDGKPVPNVRVYGGVGTGKSRLADLFASTLPPSISRRRIHFHEFMLDVHHRLHLARSQSHYTGDPLVQIGRDVFSESRVLCFLLMLLGIVIMGFGSAVQALPEFGRGAYEAFTFAFVDKNGWPVQRVRIILDVIMVVTGVLLGGKAGLCTIATIPICGPVIQVSLKWLKKVLGDWARA